MTSGSSSALPIDLDAPVDLESPPSSGHKGFSVHLVNFDGPFDLLLQLIAKHKLDITEIALSQVTDDFIAHIKAGGPKWDLDQTSEFLLVAATLLDLKAARLLPQAEVEDAEDLALLEARDLLFARLLQYRAFKQIAALVNQRMAEEAKRFARSVSMEPRFAELLPEVLLGIDPAGLAALAARALAPKPIEEVSLTHLHAPSVTVREQALVVVDRLRFSRSLTFRDLIADSPDTVTTVCRFLSLLELFRASAVAFDQVTPLGELTVRWTGSEEGDVLVSAEFDEEAKAPEDAESVDAGPEPEFEALAVLTEDDVDVDEPQYDEGAGATAADPAPGEAGEATPGPNETEDQ
ncbi:segregation/condensation protein A [Kribbella sp. NBC_01245]|uniref:segregation and condensation protein A n=1 Tax=Kribbella sp. NBC_01245 TaxID=2903578 RepID=UPI002E2BE482|nr:segregation/condensation protein A [Kribbella sp. NBC_01245]